MSSSGLLCEMVEKHDFNRRDSVEDKIILEKLDSLSSTQEQTEDDLRNQEADIIELGERYCQEGKTEAMSDLIKKVRPFLRYLSKVKAAKLVRALVDMFLDINDTQPNLQKKLLAKSSSSHVKSNEVDFNADFMRDDDVRRANADLCIQLCKECIEWAKEEHRTFLRQSLEARLVALYYDGARYTDALNLIATLLRELKKLDDKHLLVEVQLLESRTYLELGNVTKSRAALTSSRTTANAIYIAPRLQAELEMQAGILHCSSSASSSQQSGSSKGAVDSGGLMALDDTFASSSAASPLSPGGGSQLSKEDASTDLANSVYYSGGTGAGDFKTAYSHFYESFELFDSVTELKSVSGKRGASGAAGSSSAGGLLYYTGATAMAVKALKYMLLTKIMMGEQDDVQHIVSNTKVGLKYYAPKRHTQSALGSDSVHPTTGPTDSGCGSGEDADMAPVTRHLEAMLAISCAAKRRSLSQFNATKARFAREIVGDRVVARHLGRLFQTMLEHNLCRIIEPYSRIEVAYIASKMGLHPHHVERKLSQMILDKKFEGILDQANGVLIVYGSRERDVTYDTVLATLDAMAKVVDRLFVAAKKLT